MNKSLYFFLILFLCIFCHRGVSDEVAQKTDGSFVGEDTEKPINSTFVGDISNSIVNESGDQDNLQGQTDNAFDGNELHQDNSLFAGRGFDEQVKTQKDAPFAGDKPVDTNSYDN